MDYYKMTQQSSKRTGIALIKLARWVIFFLSIGLASTSALVFYRLGTGGIPSETGLNEFEHLIKLNFIFIITLIVILGMRVYALLKSAPRQGIKSSSLQRKVTGRFVLVAFLPAAVISIFSAIFFSYGIKSWFDHKVSTALISSSEVAEAYLKEHIDLLRADALAMAADLNHEISYIATNPEFFNKIVSGQAALRSLTEAVVVSGGRIIAKSELSFSLLFDKLPGEAFTKAESGEVATITSEQGDRVRAIVAINAAQDTFLIIGRQIDAKVLDYMEGTKGAVKEYLEIKRRVSRIQQRFLSTFIAFSILMVILATYYGVKYSIQLTRPIGTLIEASEKVIGGDLSSRVPVGQRIDEISNLCRSFNRMTEQLERQHGDLISSNRLLEERKYFIETVLSGVTAGVIALDERPKIFWHLRMKWKAAI